METVDSSGGKRMTGLAVAPSSEGLGSGGQRHLPSQGCGERPCPQEMGRVQLNERDMEGKQVKRKFREEMEIQGRLLFPLWVIPSCHVMGPLTSFLSTLSAPRQHCLLSCSRGWKHHTDAFTCPQRLHLCS